MILVGDCRDSLRALPERSVQTCVTSPPYFGLRDYGTGEWEGGEPDCDHAKGTAASARSTLKNDGRPNPGSNNYEHSIVVPYRDVCGKCGARRVDRQIGLEPTPDEFVQALVAVFREVRRVLRDDGTVWLNLGDSYAGSWGNQGRKAERGSQRPINGEMLTPVLDGRYPDPGRNTGAIPAGADYKAKDLLGVPWMVAFALRTDGWYLRSDIIWAKPNPMPESVTDRPTKSHEYLFLLSKGPRYFYDADAIRETWADDRNGASGAVVSKFADPGAMRQDGGVTQAPQVAGRNRRSVWTVATQPFPGAHFATFPPKLIEPCVLAGTSPKACGTCGAPWQRVVERKPMVVRPTEKRANWQAEDDHARTQVGGTMLEPPESRTTGREPSCTHNDDTGTCIVLDPFAGSGTVGVVCGWHGREFVGCELNPDYAAMADARIALEGRPGGKPAHHEPVRVIADQLGLL